MRTIVRAAWAKITRERSRFLAFAVPVVSAEQVEHELGRLRREHHGARHIPHAYRLATGEARASDDGEPAGSAGRPIRSLLEAEDLGGVLVAVVRYFGGVKLGVGNLARAYRDAAREALRLAGVRELVPEVQVRVVTSPGRLGAALAHASRLGARILDQEVGEQVRLTVALPQEKFPLLRAAVAPWGQVEEVGPG